MPCPLCGAKDCAKFLGFYERKQVCFSDIIYIDVEIVRFICGRLNPVPSGTHRTFSLLPCQLVPQSQYSIQSTLEVAAALDDHSGNTYQTAKAVDSLYTEINPELDAIAGMGNYVREAIDKLNRLPQEILKAISWSIPSSTPVLSDFISFIKNYQSQVLANVSGACALSYDYFYLFQKDLSYMQRDFLFGTPSQKYLSLSDC